MPVLVHSGDSIHFLARNPKRQKTAAWERYETYKVATTVGDALKLSATLVDIKHDLRHCFASKLRGAAEASLQAAPSSILAGSTNRAVGASLHAASSQEGSKESHDSEGEALEIVFDKGGDRAQEQTRELQAQLQAERVAVSRLRDEAQRSAEHIQALQAQLQAEREHIQALQAQLQAERAAVSRLGDEVRVCKAEAASAQQKTAELCPSPPPGGAGINAAPP